MVFGMVENIVEDVEDMEALPLDRSPRACATVAGVQ